MSATDWAVFLAVLMPFVFAEGYAIGRWMDAKDVVDTLDAHTATLNEYTDHIRTNAALVRDLTGELAAYHDDERAHPLRPMVMTPLRRKMLDELWQDSQS